MIRALLLHRSLLASLVRREFQLRSARALWGLAWLVIEPAIQIAIYTLVFGPLIGARLPGEGPSTSYGVFVCGGLLTWHLFAQIIVRGQTLFIEHGAMIKSLRFPRSILPIYLVIVSSIQFAIAVALFAVVLAMLGRFDSVALLANVPVVGIQMLFALGIAVFAGTMQVFFRDVGNAVGVGLQFWFWMTPIVYPLEIVPEVARTVIERNPLTPLVLSYQAAVLYGDRPDWPSLVPPAIVALGCAVGSWIVFRALSAELVDEL